MAQYRCSVQKALSRGKGQSAVAKAAYNAREKIRDERTGELKDYSRNKHEVLFSGIFVDPKRNAPAWVQDRSALWNAASAAEKNKNAREAQEIIVNLPHELSDQQRRFMLTDFVREQITRGTGRIADVRPYLARASVAVVPLRIARGIQNKLLEAMAMGLPAVACSAVAGGVEATPGRDLFVTDDPVDFAAATMRLLCDVELRRRIGEAARACMEANYRWEHQLERLDRVLEAVTGKGSPEAAPLAQRN